MIDSKYCKAALFSYLRFNKGVRYIASECGLFSADILFITKKRKLVEIEIKTSKSDFRADFKKYKHEDYHLKWEQLYEKYNLSDFEWYKDQYHEDHYRVKGVKSDVQFFPSQFYFAVPADMVNYVCNYLDKHNHGYGVLVIHDVSEKKNSRLLWKQRVSVARRAKKIHNREASWLVHNKIVARMGSELANLWQKAIK